MSEPVKRYRSKIVSVVLREDYDALLRERDDLRSGLQTAVEILARNGIDRPDLDAILARRS
jgi:hypothetical protein